MTRPLEGRLAVVTGASRGIGYAVSVELAARGAHIVAVARTVGGLEDLDDAIRTAGSSATLVPLDLHDHAALDRLGQSIHERWGSLDILVGNAGILGSLTPISHIDPGEWADLLDVNLTSNWRLIRSLDALLRQSDAGRAVFVTSGAARKHRAYWGGYAMSKAALESVVLTYAEEVENSGLRVNLFNPGPTRTAMRAKAMPGEDPATLPTPDKVAAALVELTMPECQRHGTLVSYPDIEKP